MTSLHLLCRPRPIAAAISTSLPIRRRLVHSSAYRLSGKSSAGPYSAPVPTTSTLHPYLVIGRDAPSALSTRLSVREEHLADARMGKQTGRITFGGALLSRDHAETGEAEEKTKSIIGSVLLVMGESEEEVRRLVEKDVYSTSGVFDKVDIYPFLPASLGAAATVAGEAEAASEAIKEVKAKAAASLGQLRETETSKWQAAAMQSLEWLRKGNVEKQIS